MKKLRLLAFTLLLVALLLPMRASTAQLDMEAGATSDNLFDRIPPPITDFFIPAQQVSAEPPTKRSASDFIGRIYAPKPEDWEVRSDAHPITDVTVTIMSGTRTGENVTTDKNGYYLFPEVRGDELHLRMEKEHFESKEVIVHRFLPTKLANGAVLNYPEDVQQNPGSILMGQSWPDEVRFLFEETLVVSDLLYVEGGVPPVGENIGGFYSRGVIVNYSHQFAQRQNSIGVLILFAHEIAHARQHALVSVDGSAWGIHDWNNTPEGIAYKEAREKDWNEVGKAQLDMGYDRPDFRGNVLTETAAETMAYYWSVDRWGGRPRYGDLRITAPNRFKWAAVWLQKQSERLQPLSKILGDNQAGLSNTPLPFPFAVVVRNRDDGFPLSGVPVTFTVTTGGGTLSTTRTTTNLSGIAESTLILGADLGTNTVEVSAAGIAQTVTFTAVGEGPVDIPDPNLRAAIESDLSKTAGAPISKEEMATLRELNARDANITDLTGLGHATNLTRLELVGNRIEDVAVLTRLTKLRALYLDNNAISDISPLAGLTNLTHLGLEDNMISEISALVGLTDLTWLRLPHNSISDISALMDLTRLTTLMLTQNNISDISPLSGLTHLTKLHLHRNTISDILAISRLTKLTELRLERNSISDLFPLVANIGLGDGDLVIVDENPLNYTSINIHIPALEARGITIEFDNRRVERLLKISGDDQKGVSGETLTHPFVVEVRDGNGDAFEGVPIAFDVTAGGGTLSITNLTTDANGRAQSTLTLGSDTGTNTIRVRVEGISESVTFNAIAKAVVNIPDPGLSAAIEATLDKPSGDPITVDEMATLTRLDAAERGISDLTGLEFATNLTFLNLRSNNIQDISPVSGLINLTYLSLSDTGISDITPLSGLTHLTRLELHSNAISNISPLEELTSLTTLMLQHNAISNISPLEGLINLTSLRLWNNTISNISPLAGLTNLEWLGFDSNAISDISPVSGLTNLVELKLFGNSISDIEPLVANTGLGEGDTVDVGKNPLNYPSIYTHIPVLQERGVDVAFNDRTPTTLLKISGDDQKGIYGETLTHPFVVEVRDRNDDVFEGVPVTFNVTAGGGTFSITNPTTDENGRAESTFTLGNNVGMNTVSVSASEIQGTVTFNAVAEGLEFDLSVPMGTSLIHVPLKVTAVDDTAKSITSIADLYDALGGVDTVNFLVTHDLHTQKWRSYLAPSDKGTPADSTLTADTGIIAGMKTAVSLRLSGIAWGTNGTSTITLNQGLNLVGIPLRDERINRVSDLLRLDGIWGNVPVITVSDGGKFKVVGRAGDPGDIAITGGGAFILNARQTATVEISGEAWTNVSEAAAAPLVTHKGIEVGDATPVLALRGSVVDEEVGLKVEGFRVTVKNLSTGRAVATLTAPDASGYRLTVVDIETGRAAAIGDVLEISAQSPDPFIGVEAVRYTVTAEDVRQSLIQLPELVAYEIPAETQLLANYPNPFNPETWIPYRLAEDAFVTLTIYDGSGQVVRTLDIGHQVAAVYESRSKAIYWDGRNTTGEAVASGVYFYHLSAGDYSATRKMVILK